VTYRCRAAGLRYDWLGWGISVSSRGPGNIVRCKWFFRFSLNVTRLLELGCDIIHVDDCNGTNRLV